MDTGRRLMLVCLPQLLIEDLCSPGTVGRARGLAVSKTKPACRGERHCGVIAANKKTQQGKTTLRTELYFIKAGEGEILLIRRHFRDT